MKRFFIEITKPLYQGNLGIPGTNILNDTEWNGLTLPIELPNDYEKEKEEKTLATICITEKKGEKIDNFFVVRIEEAIRAARFQKKWNIAKALTAIPITIPCNYIGIHLENCRVVIDYNNEEKFSQKELCILTELTLRINTSVLDINLLNELWKMHGFTIYKEREDVFKIKK